MLKEQIKRAQKSARARDAPDEPDDGPVAPPQDGEKVKLSFGTKLASSTAKPASLAAPAAPDAPEQAQTTDSPEKQPERAEPPASRDQSLPFKMTGAKPQPKNVFAQKKVLAGGSKKKVVEQQPKKMSEAERIMREEMDRKRGRESLGGAFGGPHSKKQKR